MDQPRTCHRGHQITGKNLIRNGRQTRCRACIRAHSKIANFPDRADHFDRIAHEFYETFMAGYDSITQARQAALVEDVEWMARHGENLTGAAERLGIRPDQLHKRLKNARHPELYQHLIHNEQMAAA